MSAATSSLVLPHGAVEPLEMSNLSVSVPSSLEAAVELLAPIR
jgi:hypothetical protein